MVVAARAGDREPHERLRRHLDSLVDHVVDHLHLVLLGDRLRAEREEPGGDDSAHVHPAGRFGRQQIPGQLLGDEAVVGQVAVEGVDHIVSVAPGVWVAMVLVQPGRIGVARNVEPVSPPALAVARTGEQPVDEALVPVR